MPQGVSQLLVTINGSSRCTRQKPPACTRMPPPGLPSPSLSRRSLAYAQWDVGPRVIVSAWLIYMLLVSAARFVVVRRYWRASSSDIENGRWNTAFVVGVAMAAAGWGAGAIVLYPSARPMNEILLVFAVGGVMLGGASTLAARPEAFLTFLSPDRSSHLPTPGERG